MQARKVDGSCYGQLNIRMLGAPQTERDVTTYPVFFALSIDILFVSATIEKLFAIFKAVLRVISFLATKGHPRPEMTSSF